MSHLTLIRMTPLVAVKRRERKRHDRPNEDIQKRSGLCGQKRPIGTTRVKVPHDGGVTIFDVKNDSRLEKVMMAFGERSNLELLCVRFLREVDRVDKEYTPMMLHLGDDNVLEVFIQLWGGGGRICGRMKKLNDLKSMNVNGKDVKAKNQDDVFLSCETTIPG